MLNRGIIFFALTFFCTFTYNVEAQKKYYIGINNTPVYWNYPLHFYSPSYYNDSNATKKTLALGVHLGRELSNKIAIQSMVIFNYRRTKDSCYWGPDTVSSHLLKSIRNCNYTYSQKQVIIRVPIELVYTIIANKKFVSYVSSGLLLTYSISDKKFLQHKITDKVETYKNNFKKSIEIGYLSRLGIKYSINENVRVFTDISLISDYLSLRDLYYGFNVGVETFLHN